jgi:hypothetical protein
MRVESSRAFESADHPACLERAAWPYLVLLVLGTGVIFFFVTGALWFVVIRFLSAPLDSEPFRGVRLGMAPESVRASFVDGAVGRWSTSPSCCGDRLEWTRGGPGDAPTRWARFEFQDGVLVAIRMLADSSTPVARRVDVRPAAVVETTRAVDGSTHTLVLARGSEAHRAEVRQILATPSSP